MSTATTSAVDREKFRKIWIEKVKEQARPCEGPPKGNAWEGFDAYRELKDTNNLWLVLPNAGTGEWPFSYLTDRLSREVHIYKLYESSVVPDNQCFRIAIDALSDAKEKLKEPKTPESKVKSEVDKRLSECASAIDKALRSIEQRRDSYWEDVLFAEPEERMKWPVYIDDQRRIHQVPPQKLAEWQRIFDRAKYPGIWLDRLTWIHDFKCVSP
jgi:hypothetical protein